MISSFEFAGLYPVAYASNAPDSTEATFLNSHRNGNAFVAFERQTEMPSSNNSLGGAKTTHVIISSQDIENLSNTRVTCMVPPCGGYRIDSNGLWGSLLISSVDGQGNIRGSINNQNISGFWDPISKKITFTQTIGTGSNNSLSYKYTGFYHVLCGGGVTIACAAILGGSAIPIGLRPEQAAKQEFGWAGLRLGA